MKTYILLLRGINVGGHRKIKMADLRATLEKIGFQKVASYIQSGNVIFSSDESDVSKIQQKIEQHIAAHFGFDVKCFIISEKKFTAIIKNNPFLKKGEPIEKLYCTFLEGTPLPESIQNLNEYRVDDEEYTHRDNILYFCYHNGYGKAKISNPFIEKKLKLGATTRNWKTMLKLRDMI
ncbi:MULTISPECIES: DUF1697 domain-containing protein [Galbibacter]|uniref:DUF1697 domain-containing protein n=1 Tax=Galbibacter pacificus TaxID=2996052 RepID=A0ABT6FS53_9FLAO|nr:DUF1697 domain-containing protein [Galbibacter pacificus]MDG3582805.1 DUF1697 domain-containing protein [Galbibacter pacificus]MDG3586076.1 DUF1697 domain-containing protein [Galbibacter pacificus]